MVHRFLINLLQNHVNNFHLLWIISLHYLAKLEILIERVLQLTCHRKKLQNLPHLICGLQICQIWVDYSVWGVLQEKVYKTRITYLNKLKHRLGTEWANWIMSLLRQPFVNGVVDSFRSDRAFAIGTDIGDLHLLFIYLFPDRIIYHRKIHNIKKTDDATWMACTGHKATNVQPSIIPVGLYTHTIVRW